MVRLGKWWGGVNLKMKLMRNLIEEENDIVVMKRKKMDHCKWNKLLSQTNREQHVVGEFTFKGMSIRQSTPSRL